MAHLDESRRRQTAAALDAAGHPAVLLETAFEALCVQETGGTPGAYGVRSNAVDLARGEPITPPPAARPAAMARRRRVDVRALAIGMGQRPWLTDTGDLVVPTHGAFLARAGLTLVVKRRRQMLLQLPMGEIKHVSIVGQGVAVSSSAVAACVERGIRIWFSNRSCVRGQVPVSRGGHGVVGAPRRAVYVLVDGTAAVRRRIGASLCRLGYVALVPGVFWTTAARVATLGRRSAIGVVLRRAARQEPFVAVVFRGEAPLGREATWIRSVGKEQRR